MGTLTILEGSTITIKREDLQSYCNKAYEPGGKADKCSSSFYEDMVFKLRAETPAVKIDPATGLYVSTLTGIAEHKYKSPSGNMTYENIWATFELYWNTTTTSQYNYILDQSKIKIIPSTFKVSNNYELYGADYSKYGTIDYSKYPYPIWYNFNYKICNENFLCGPQQPIQGTV